MHNIVKFFGALTVLLGVLALGLATLLLLASGQAVLPRILLPAGLSALVTGAILYCFGAIVAHLAAIRDLQARQLTIFETRMARNRADS